MGELGVLDFNEGDVSAAEHWLSRAAELGNQLAMFNLGLLYHNAGQSDRAERWWLGAHGRR